MNGQYLKISFGNCEPKQWGRLCVTVRTNRSSGDAYVSPFRRTEAVGTPMCHRSDEHEHIRCSVSHFRLKKDSLDA